MTTANQAFFDAQLRHATSVARYSAGEARRVIALLDKANAELTQLVQSTGTAQLTIASRRYKAMLRDIQQLRQQLWATTEGGHQENLFKLASGESTWVQSALARSVPVELSFASVDADTLRKLITETPFAAGANAAKTLQQWWGGLAAVDTQRITEALQLGVSLGESTDELVRRVMDTYSLTRANAAAVVRTAVNHVSETSRNEFWKANADLLQCLRWTSTLDGRTTPICQARDGKFAPVVPDQEVPEPRLNPPAARPPAHASCRSLMIGILDADNIADQLPERPFVRDTRTGRKREIDLRAEAKAQAGTRWNSMSAAERTAAVRAQKQAWARENIGQVPGTTTYDEWLRTQPKAFQDDVLGPGRAKLFRGGEKLDSFVAPDGRELTLKQLYAEENKVAEIVNDRSRLASSTSEPWSEARQKAWEDSLTDKERSAFEDWTHTWDQDIRSVQRTGELTGEYPGRLVPEVESRIQSMEAALARGVAREGEVFRGLALHQEDIDKLMSSETWSNTCFSSASRKLSLARGFAFQSSYGMNVDAGFEETLGNHYLPVVFRIKNRTGIDINNLSWWTKQREMPESETLLRPGATYRVLTGAEVNIPGEGRVWVVDMEEVWP